MLEAQAQAQASGIRSGDKADKMMGVPRPDAWLEALIGPWRVEPNPSLAVTIRFALLSRLADPNKAWQFHTAILGYLRASANPNLQFIPRPVACLHPITTPQPTSIMTAAQLKYHR